MAEDTEVSRSLIYCLQHKVRADPPNTCQQHQPPLLKKELLAAWRLHYAERYPHLESSKRVLAEAEVGGWAGGWQAGRMQAD